MQLLVLSILLAGALAHECGISAPIEDQETVGIAPLGKWPWQVYVHTPDGFCGGSIIADRWILTAAHCFDDQLEGVTFDRNPLIRTGVVNIEEASKDDYQYKNLYEAKTIHAHKDYNITTCENDIALLELERPITYSDTVAPICLTHANQDVNIYQEAWIIGFGHYVDDDTHQLVTEVSNVLREAQIPLARHSSCEIQWKDDIESSEKIICAGSHGIGAGEGDSGGPLMLQSVDGPWYQAGVVSFGKNDSEIATNHTIGAYTSVGHYCDWIELMTRGEVKCAEKVVEMKLRKDEEREETETEDDEDEDQEEREDESTATAEDGDEVKDQKERGEEDDGNEKKEEGDGDDEEHEERQETKFSLYNIPSYRMQK